MHQIYTGYGCLVCALLILGCKQTQLSPTPVNKVQIKSSDVTVAVVKDSAAADGVTVNAFRFTGGPSVDSFYSAVTFSITPNGLFSNDSTKLTVPIDDSGHATVYAFSQMPGATLVTASVDGVTSPAAEATFTIAWPQEVVITTDSTFLTPLPGIWTGVTATLLRNPGKVSPGIVVNFYNYDSTRTDSNIGTFEGSTVSDTSGIVNRQFYIIDTGYHGVVFITGEVVLTPKDTVQGTTRLQMR